MTPKARSKRIKPQEIALSHETSSSPVEKAPEKAATEPTKKSTGGRSYKKKRPPKETEEAPRAAKAVAKGEVVVEALPDFFDHEDAGGKDKLSHDVEILVMEWAFFYPNHSPTSYILDIKGYSESQRIAIFKLLPADDWPKRRSLAQDKLTGELVKRHVDTMAKVQDEHISASKLGLARAVQMLAEGKTEIIKKDGKPVLDAAGNPKFKQFRSIDLLNCMSAIEKAQNIYRRAMGLPNDEGGLQQILNKLERMREAPTVSFNLTQHNTQVNNTTQVQVNQGEQRRNPTDLSYDDIMLLIEAKREQKAKQAQSELDERLKIEHKEGVPTGDFTALPQKPGA